MKAKFDANSPYWVEDFDYNLMFLKFYQNHFNDKLKAKGHVTIFEVYDALGLKIDYKRLSELERPKKLWWNYKETQIIEFGTKPIKDENVILLDFNIDIY